MTKADKRRLCHGCRDDFYNRPGNSTDGECWMLASARPVEKTKVGTWQPPPYEWLPDQTLHCHQPEGYHWIDKSDLRIWQPPPYEWLPDQTLHCHQPEGYHWIDKSDLRIRRSDLAATNHEQHPAGTVADAVSIPAGKS